MQIIIIQTTIKQLSKMQRPKITALHLTRTDVREGTVRIFAPVLSGPKGPKGPNALGPNGSRAQDPKGPRAPKGPQRGPKGARPAGHLRQALPKGLTRCNGKFGVPNIIRT